MLYLLFYVGSDRYIIEAGSIVSIIPLLKMHKMAGVPDYMVGYINYKGQTVPVTDISKLIRGKKSKSRLSTRIVLVDYFRHNSHKTLGFIVEQATEVVKLAPQDFTPNMIDSDPMPFLGPIAKDADGMLQAIDIQGLIDAKIRDFLNGQAA